MALPKELATWATIFISALALGVSLFIEYTHTDAADHATAMANEHRITAVEQKVDNQKNTIDHVQTQVDKLVEWALGSK